MLECLQTSGQTDGQGTKTNPNTSPEQSAKNMTSRVFTRKNVLTKFNKTAQPTGGHVFSPIWTIFKLVRDINKTNVLTKFHDDWVKNERNVLTKFLEDWTKNVTYSLLTCFHYIHIAKAAPPLGGHVFSPIWTIFELVCDINKTNVLTKLYDDWAKIVTSRAFIRKTAPPTGGHVFQRTGTTFKLNQHIMKTNILTNIIGTNLLTKFHEDRTRNVASIVFTTKCGRTNEGRTYDGQRPIPKAHMSNQVS
ncbi:hypothetical protein DPMN_082044 [Dreissena polymorpha]|uniref:Uncharacterized protein n=1 Tax=Dreissena polymorpha TaxID=45954 RepID=A0A9D3Y9S4_DREPO|nr:hypothetical protein DPMN_082044 [Dreissena polymorpha]